MGTKYLYIVSINGTEDGPDRIAGFVRFWKAIMPGNEPLVNMWLMISLVITFSLRRLLSSLASLSSNLVM